jgi:hypothetical protein
MIMHGDKVWERYRPAVVLYSPQDDAVSTCFGILPTDLTTAVGGPCEVKPCQELLEKGNRESSLSFRERTTSLKNILTSSAAETIFIVGHSNYFQGLLRPRTSVQHCDIWLACFQDGDFADWKVLYRTTLAEGIPGGEDSEDDEQQEQEQENDHSGAGRRRTGGSPSRASAAPGGKDGDNAEAEVENDLNENEPCCRICHVSGVHY